MTRAMLVDGGGGSSGSDSTPDYHGISLPHLIGILNVKRWDALAGVQQDWQHLATALYQRITSSDAISLDSAIAQLGGGWSGQASTHFMERLSKVRDLGMQIVAGASKQASDGNYDVEAGEFDTPVGMISDSQHRMYDAYQYYSGNVKTCLGELQQWLCGYQVQNSMGRFTATQKGQASTPWGSTRPVYNFTYDVQGYLLDEIKFSGEFCPYVATTGGGGRFASGGHADGAATLSTTAGPWSKSGQIALNPSADPNLLYNAFEEPVLHHQLALLLSWSAPVAYQMPRKMFPAALTSPAISASTQPNGSNGSNGTGGPGGYGGGGGIPPGGFGGGSYPGGGGGAGGGSVGPGGGSFGTGGSGGPVPTINSGGGKGPGWVPPTVGGHAPTQLAGFNPPATGGGLPGGLGASGLGGSGLSGGGLGSAGAGLGGAGDGLGSGLGAGAGGAAGSAIGAAASGRAMPMMPPMMPPMGAGNNNDNSRQRKSWLPEDEDIWGGQDAAVPPVISGDS